MHDIMPAVYETYMLIHLMLCVSLGLPLLFMLNCTGINYLFIIKFFININKI